MLEFFLGLKEIRFLFHPLLAELKENHLNFTKFFNFIYNSSLLR